MSRQDFSSFTSTCDPKPQNALRKGSNQPKLTWFAIIHQMLARESLAYLQIGPKYGHTGSPALGSSNSTRRSLPRGFLCGCWEHATHLQCFSGVHVFCIVCSCYTKSVTLPETICNLNISFLVAVVLMRSSKASPTIRNREPPCWASCKYRGVAQAFENLKQPSLQQKVLWTQPNKRGSILPMSDCKSGSVFNRSTTSCSKNRSHEKFQKFQTTKWGRSFQNPKKNKKMKN